MAKYLHTDHDRYVLDEEPTNFSDFALLETVALADRTFWVWACTDGFGWIWDILVGCGRTPAFGKTGNEVWMHGERNYPRLSPRALIARECPEHRAEMIKH
jgi:hypothetical protein